MGRMAGGRLAAPCRYWMTLVSGEPGMSNRHAGCGFALAVFVSSLAALSATATRTYSQGASSQESRRQQPSAPTVLVWDTLRRLDSGPGSEALRDRSEWAPAPVGASQGYRFKGDCVVENGRLRLVLPAGKSSAAYLCGLGDDVVQPSISLYEYDSQDRTLGAPSSIKILRNEGHEAVLEYEKEAAGGATARVAYRVAGGRHWIEVKPLENAGRLGVGVRSRLVIAPVSSARTSSATR